MLRMSKKFFADETAATAIEYSLIASGIAAAIVATVNGLGTSVNGMWRNISTAIK